MAGMTEPHHGVIARLSADFAAMSRQLARVSADLTELERVLSERPGVPQQAPQPAPTPAVPYWWPPPPPPSARPDGWIGKVLAVAGVAVTLIGVVLLLVLAAQAGILRPEIRVGAGGVLAGTLVAVAGRLYGRPGGRIGAIALAATGIAAAYIDVVAVTTIYDWLPAPVGLVTAAVIGGGGLTLARRWDSEHLGLLVLVPLIGLAPAVTDGVTLLLIGFMLALSAASLPVQLGKDWIWMHAARTVAGTFPLLVALAAAHFGSSVDQGLLAGACGVAAVLAIGGALILLPGTRNRVAMASVTVVGAVPLLSASVGVDRVVAALMAAALAAAMLAIVLIGDRLPSVSGIVGRIWSALSAVSALIAVTVAFDGQVAVPVLLALAVVVAVAGRRDDIARWAALGFAIVGGGLYLSYAPPSALVRAWKVATPEAVSTLVASVLLAAGAVAIVWSWVGRGGVDNEAVRVMWAGCATVIVYAVTTFTVTAGVVIGGAGRGFFAGHMAATICWIAMAAALFGYAARLRARADRSLPIAGGLALVAAAITKLFLFDLGTLDGIFRVVVFMVVGLVLLGMGAGYARLLAQQDEKRV
jgi:hypothetical protein